MNALPLGIVLGLICGAASVALMLPMSFPDKPTALAAAFASRFMLGLFSATVTLSLHPILAGAVVGLLVSIPDALITKAYVPILGLGLAFGLICGVAVTYLRT